VSIEAGRASWLGESGRYLLEEGVVLRRGAVVLRARTATLDPATREVQATGGVLLTDATKVIAADGIRAVLDGPFEADDVIAFVKEGAVDLSGAKTIEEARRTGGNRVTFSGERATGDGSGRLQLHAAHLTLCDCGDRAPSWELRTRHADVIPDERAILSWPVLYVTPRFLFVERPIPVLVVPWLYLPLGDRQTGLLVTQVGSTGATGFSIAQPLFVTLGESADATFTPEYMFGRSRDQVEAGKPAVRGFGARLELRWAPAPGAGGQVELHGVRDLDREPGGAGGNRMSIVGTHAQRLGEATRLRADVALASDPVWYRDFTSDVLAREAYYARSDLLLSRRADALVLEASLAYLQPLTPDRRPEGLVYGTFGADVPVMHRWPSAAATLLPTRLGPFSLSGRAGVARFAPISGDTGELGPGDPGRRMEAEGLGVALPRPAATRGNLRLELSAPLLLHGVSLTPFVRGAAAGYAWDSRDPALVAWGVGGLSVSTELSRRLGGLEHRIAPRAELWAGTRAVGLDEDEPFPAYDAWDRVATGAVVVDGSEVPVLRRLSAAPGGGGYTQLRLAVENRLEAGAAGHLRLEVGQDFDLRAGTLAETFVTGAGVKGPFSAEASARFLAFGERPTPAPPPQYPSPLDDLTELRANVALTSPRGHALRASIFSLGPGASGTAMAGVDALFDLRPAALEGAAQGSVGVRGVFGGATLGYDALFPVRPTDVARCSGPGLRRIEPWQVQQHAASAIWNSPCRCFVARLVVRVNDCGEPSYSATIDLSQLGERAAFR
jgi:LPS-assembly protein